MSLCRICDMQNEPMFLGQDYITTERLAKALSLSSRTLSNWRVRSEGPAFTRAGGRVLYKTSDVQAWLDANRIEPTQPQQ